MTDWKAARRGPDLGMGQHTYLRDDDDDQPAGMAGVPGNRGVKPPAA